MGGLPCAIFTFPTGVLVDTNMQMQIAQRAYRIWQHKGCPDGKDLENWLEAEAAVSLETTPAQTEVFTAVATKRGQRRKPRN
jgi:hypothetical protein